VTGGSYLSRKAGYAIARPLWTQERLHLMNEKFAKALRKAIEAGQERCTVGVSTAAGTKFPVYYLPGDWG
jgi:hypothetical protein